MAVPMPAVVVLITCKVILGEPDHNSKFTHYRPSTPDMTGGFMRCRRQEIQLYDSAVDQGAQERPFTQWACNQAGMKMGAQFDIDNENKPWRFKKVGCPVPIVDTRTGEIIAWKIPDCGNLIDGAVICESDTAI